VIIDSSALIAILRFEPETDLYMDAIRSDFAPSISAATFLEAATVIDGRRDPILSRRFEELLTEASISIAPFTAEQARIARDAYRDFGRGSGNPAQLNFGDCFAYALAKSTGEPLLFKGNDFTQTDITPAIPQP
jgi:ribonuclease VapC